MAVVDDIHLELPVLLDGRDEDVVIGFAGHILRGLPTAVVVDRRPGGHRPAVVDLPEERAPAITFLPAVALYGSLHGVALKQLAHIEQLAEVFGLMVFVGQIGLDEMVGIFSTALVSHHHVGIDVPVGGVGSKLLHRSKLRKALHTIFGEEARTLLVVVGHRLLTVPNIPVVPVALVVVAAVAVVAKWRRRPVGHIGVVGLHGIGQCVVEDVLIFLPHAVGLTEFLILLLPSPIVPSVLALIVAAPKGNARVVAKADDVVLGFLLHIV